MKQLLIDSNAYVAFVRGDPAAVEIVRLAHHIGLSTVVLGELLAGFAAGGREARNREIRAQFLASPRVSLLPVTQRTEEVDNLLLCRQPEDLLPRSPATARAFLRDDRRLHPLDVLATP